MSGREPTVHIAVLPAGCWDDIIYTRKTMLLFRSEESIDRWCEAQGVERRPTVSLDQLWHLATTWYENRLTPDSRCPAPNQMGGIFSRIGLTGHFWDPKSDHWRRP